MTISAGKAWALGVGFVLVAYAAWFVSLRANRFSEVLALFLWGAPALAAFVTAYLAPRKKILLGASIALLAATLAGMLNFAYEALGNAVDFPGVRGGAILVAIALVFNGVLCTVGATCGYFLARKFASKDIGQQ